MSEYYFQEHSSPWQNLFRFQYYFLYSESKPLLFSMSSKKLISRKKKRRPFKKKCPAFFSALYHSSSIFNFQDISHFLFLPKEYLLFMHFNQSGIMINKILEILLYPSWRVIFKNSKTKHWDFSNKEAIFSDWKGHRQNESILGKTKTYLTESSRSQWGKKRSS